MRELFRRYLDARSATYRNVEDQAATKAKLAEGAALQGEIWTKALTACQKAGRACTSGHAPAPRIE